MQALFALPRILLGVTAFSALAAAGTIAFGVSEETISIVWKVCAGLSALIAVILTVTFLRAKPIVRRGLQAQT